MSRSRHPKTIIAGYRLFLMGCDEAEIANAGISVSEIEIDKIKKFHQYMQAGKSYFVAGRVLGLPEQVSKRMWIVYCDWQAGNSISCADSSRKNRPHVVPAYELLLQGAEEDELRASGCTETEIEKAKLFSQYADNDMLPTSISRKTGISVSTVKKLQKIYRDKCNFSMAREGMMMI